MARWFLSLVVALALFGPIWSLAGEDPLSPDTPTDYELHKLLVDTINQVEQSYVKPIDRRKLVEAAIRGVLSELDDYSGYVAPEKMGGFKTAVSHQFGGVGIRVGMERGQLTVLSPLVGSPAYRAGLIAGDRILEIDGKSIDGLRLDDAVELMKGESGTPVTLKIRHAGRKEAEDVELIREVIQLETVLGDVRDENDQWDYLLDDDLRIGYVRITGFGRNTASDLRKVLTQLKDQKVAALILDLRFNPGGLLSSAIQVSDMFVSEGKIVSTEGRNVQEQTWNAKKRGTFEGFPIAVLVNRYSASASEIVAACLQDHDRAVVMGERTYGKGSVQRVIEMEGGQSALKLTTAGYHRPNGKNIDRHPGDGPEDEWGVKPNDGFDLALNDLDTFALARYQRGRDVLQGKLDAVADEPEAGSPQADDPQAPESEGDSPHGDEPEPSHESAGKLEEPEFVDRQLQLAVDYLKKQLAQQVAEEENDKAADGATELAKVPADAAQTPKEPEPAAAAPTPAE